MRKAGVLSILLVVVLLAVPVTVGAQQPTKVPLIGYLSTTGDPGDPGNQVEAFRQGLRNFGHIEGKNVLVEYRYVEGNVDRIPSLVAELVQLKVDVFVTAVFLAIRLAKQATKTIPIVMVTRELSGKRLELLKEIAPRMSRIGALWDANASGPDVGFKEYEAAARTLKITLQSLELRGPTPDFEGAFQAATKERANAVITIRNTLLNRYAKRIADLAVKNRLPSMHEGSDYVEAGGLVSYAAGEAESFRRAAYYVDRILKGTNPAELPVEQPTKFELVINLRTAKQIGVTIPQSVLYRADKVIR